VTEQATIADLPSWPCPPRTREIVSTPGSWGWLPVNPIVSMTAVWYDELGALWVDGDATPRYKRLDQACASPGAIVYWTEHGLGLYIHPKSYSCLPDRSRLDNTPSQSWLPVMTVGEYLAWLNDEVAS